jgi:type II secretory pathway component PulF
MRSRASDISEFYQQLSLLTKSNLPLPDAIRQLAHLFAKKDIRDIVQKISERTARGEKFSDVLRNYQTHFDPFHVHIIAAGEAAGTLPKALMWVARYARFNDLLTSKIRGIMAYPLLTMNLGMIAFLFISIQIMPQFHEMYITLVDYRVMPTISKYMFKISSVISENRGLVISVYVALVEMTLWLYGPWLAAHRTLLRIIRILPGSCGVMTSLDSARLCRILSVFVEQGTQLPEAVRMAAEMVEGAGLRAALSNAARNVSAGGTFAEAVSRYPAIDKTIALAFKHTPEHELAEEMTRLSELLEHRVMMAAKTATATWVALSVVVVSVWIGYVIISIFKPLITLVGLLGG